MEHHYKSEDYGPTEIDKFAFGAGDHAAAMEEAHSKVNPSGKGKDTEKNGKKAMPGGDKELMRSTRDKVKKSIATLGKRQGVESPTKN